MNSGISRIEKEIMEELPNRTQQEEIPEDETESIGKEEDPRADCRDE